MSTALNLGAWRDRTNLYASNHNITFDCALGTANTASTASSRTANHTHTTLPVAVSLADLEAMIHTARVPAC